MLCYTLAVLAGGSAGMQTPSFHFATGGFGNLGLVALSLCSCISPLFSIGTEPRSCQNRVQSMLDFISVLWKWENPFVFSLSWAVWIKAFSKEVLFGILMCCKEETTCLILSQTWHFSVQPLHEGERSWSHGHMESCEDAKEGRTEWPNPCLFVL